jgi:hypothetical protein
MIHIGLYGANDNLNGSARGGMVHLFHQELDSRLDPQDAKGLNGSSDNLFAMVEGEQLSVNCAAVPQNGDRIRLVITDLQQTDYKLQVFVRELNGTEAFLKDDYTGLRHQLDSQEMTVVDFSIDTQIPESYDTERFTLEFGDMELDEEESAFAKAITLYPNPTSDIIHIETPESSQNSTLILTNMLGQEVLKLELVGDRPRHEIDLSGMAAGVYQIKISNDVDLWEDKLVIN